MFQFTILWSRHSLQMATALSVALYTRYKSRFTWTSAGGVELSADLAHPPHLAFPISDAGGGFGNLGLRGCWEELSLTVLSLDLERLRPLEVLGASGSLVSGDTVRLVLGASD